jgi:methylated-DNA-[protein]-cysteine S-methyltransferase
MAQADPMPNRTNSYSHLDTPVGRVLLVGHQGGLAGLFVADHERCPARHPDWKEDDTAFVDVRRQLGEYFDGSRTTFDLPLDLAGTRFQVEVWSALRDIPYGHTIGYGELAARIGRPTAARAVGAANGRNPISIVIPCHRVIGGDGSLTGYGWGVERKAWLLDHERATTPRRAAALR